MVDEDGGAALGAGDAVRAEDDGLDRRRIEHAEQHDVARAATSAGEVAAVAPAATNGATWSGSRFQTVSA